MFSCCYSQQQDDHFIIRTIEKLPVHTEVINLRRLLLAKNLSDSITADFSLAKRDEFPYMYFLINHSSRGILTIRKEIDRDELCRLRRCRCDTWCDLELEIIINSEQFNIELITIRIMDRNDHKPTFSTDQLNLTIVENAQIGAMIKLESANDYDQGQNSIVGM
jgi:protocadherin delta 1